MGTVQAAIAHGVLDAVRAGDIPKSKANDLGIIVSVWLDPSVVEATKSITRSSSRPTAKPPPRRSTRRCTTSRPSTGCSKNQDKVPHYFHQLALEGKLE